MAKKWICVTLMLLVVFVGCAQERRRKPIEPIKKEIDTLNSKPKDLVHPKVNVYIENSGSMDGFVTGITDFKGAIYKLLSKLKYYYDEDNMQIFFIRNDKASSSKVPEKINVVKACENNISDFANAIDLKWRDDKKSRGHNTNLNNIFKEILDRTDDKTISILFSDCIYSIGGGGVKQMLNQEKGTTYDAFLSHGKKAQKEKWSLSTTIIKMKSSFAGKYYPYTGDNNKYIYNGELPYYICVLANQEVLADFNNNIKFAKGEIDGYDNKYILAHSENANPYYSILMATEKKGRFKQQRQCSSSKYVHGIEDVELPSRQAEAKFTFAIAIDMKDVDVEEDYISDERNYILTEDNFKIAKIEKVDKSIINPSDWQRIKDGNPTHILVLEAKDMRWLSVELGIALKKQVPRWIDECNTLDDTNSEKLKGGKSFGLKYWISGVSEAYELLYPDDKNYFKINVNIKK